MIIDSNTTNSGLKLGVLDLGFYQSSTQPSTERILETIVTAERAEKLGYNRYWVGEHHSIDVAWRGTDIILALIAGHTSKIRVGSAGILLNYYNPLLVSQNYKLLANVFSERIDLGLAQGRSEIKLIHETLTSEKNEKSMTFLQKAEFLASIFSHESTPILNSPPYNGSPPEMWLLGTSLRNLDFARQKNLNFCLSICHTKRETQEITALAEEIQSTCNPKKSDAGPQVSVMVSIICAKTQKQANNMAERAYRNLNLSFCGDQVGCYDFLMETGEKFGVSEIIISDLCGNQKDRLSSLSTLSEIMC